MLIAASLSVASALLLSAALTARPLVTTPPLVIGVTAAADIPPSLVSRVLEEAAAIWRAAGFDLVWQHRTGWQPVRSALQVWIGDGIGIGTHDQVMPLGWIEFDADGTPARAIYISHANAVTLMNLSRGSSNAVDQMPRAERDTLLGRAMGRALAHELGHFLLASKAHSRAGLMRARRTSTEFFSTDRSRFDVDAQQRALIASRYQTLGGLVAAATTLPAAPGEPGGLAGSTPGDPARFRKSERD
jgi:hypothetical protein